MPQPVMGDAGHDVFWPCRKCWKFRYTQSRVYGTYQRERQIFAGEEEVLFLEDDKNGELYSDDKLLVPRLRDCGKCKCSRRESS